MSGLLRRLLLGWAALPLLAAGAEMTPEQLDRLAAGHPAYRGDVVAWVDVSRQQLELYRDGELKGRFPVSTALKGVGNRAGSDQTPLGLHYVRKKIGAGAAPGAIFRGRVATGRIAPIETRPTPTGDDFVTTRILWLSGLEPGLNAGPGVDSFKRYIYIHGTHEEGLIGRPASHGCVRMRNRDVITLFDQMPERALVLITE